MSAEARDEVDDTVHKEEDSLAPADKSRYVTCFARACIYRRAVCVKRVIFLSFPPAASHILRRPHL